MRADRREAVPARRRVSGGGHRRATAGAAVRAAALATALVLACAAPASAAPAAAAAPVIGVPVIGAPAAGPSAALDALLVVPLLDCVSVSRDGSYRAIFGYLNTAGHTVTIPVGSANTVFPGRANGGQPTSFAKGVVHGAFATPTLTGSRWAAWRLGGGYVAAPPRNTCGPDVTLPTEGNGIGPLIVLLASLALTGAVGVVRAWRLRLGRRTAA